MVALEEFYAAFDASIPINVKDIKWLQLFKETI